jgi:hypothetical protein
MNRFKITAATLGLLTAGFAASMRADERNKETHLTITQPLQVQDVLLAPGQHVLRLTAPSVVSIYNADGTRLQGTIMGWSAYRTNASGENVFTVSQPQGNQPAALKTWFYPGDREGIDFSASKPANENRRVVKSKGKGQTTNAAGGA